MTTIDPRDLRQAFGRFMTGVTIVTTVDPQRHARWIYCELFFFGVPGPTIVACLPRKVPVNVRSLRILRLLRGQRFGRRAGGNLQYFC